MKSIDSIYIDDEDREITVLYTDGEVDELGTLEEHGIVPGKDGIDGKDGSDGKDGIDGKDGFPGLPGKNGLDGKDGEDGKDGSPDTPKEIVEKLETLEGDERLSAKSIKGLSDIVNYGGGSSRFSGLIDVVVSSPITGQVPVYDAEKGQRLNTTLSDVGITSLNGLTGITQTFATGATGTDFAISSLGTVHTFNLPTASALNRGALSTTDWTTFNSKMDNPMTTLGDIIYGGTSGSPTRLPGNVTNTQLFLAQTGDGTNSIAPSRQPIPALGTLVYYRTPTASDVATYYKLTDAPYYPITTFTVAGAINGQLLRTFVTEPSNPNRTFIPDGQYSCHIHARKTAGTKTSKLRAEVWEVNSSGVDIALIASLGASTDLSGTVAEFFIANAVLQYDLVSTSSRIATKVYAVISGGGSAPDIEISVGGTADTRTNMPAPIVSANNYVPYIGATANIDTGSFGFTTNSVNISGQTASRIAIFDASKNVIGADTATYPSLTELSYIKGVTSAVQAQINSRLSDTGDTGTGAYDFGGATSFEIPNSATPTLNATGQIAVDTTVTDFANGLLKYYSTAEYGVIAMPIAQFTTPTNGAVPTYNSTNDQFEMSVPSGGGGGIIVGTTTITSGTDTRILFQDGSVVGEDSTFRWNKTLDYLFVNNTTLSTPGISNNIWLGSYPTAIVAGGGAANTTVGSNAATTTTSGAGNTVMGTNACSTVTTGLFITAFGYQAFVNASPTRGFAAGANSQANNAGNDSFALGSLSMVNATSEIGSIMVGTNSGIGCTTGFYNIALGDGTVYNAGGASWGNVVIGRGGGQTVGGSFAANRNTLIGYGADATAGLAGTIGIGAGVTVLTSNTIVIGGTVSAPTRMYIGLGETSATPTSITISPTNGVGTNIAGADLILAGSQPTGSGNIGNIVFSTSTVGASGTTLRSLTQRAKMTETVFQSLTNGSFLMPFVAGSAAAPTYSYLFDTDTGFYSDTANTQQLSIGGTLHTTRNANRTLHTVRNEEDKGADVASASDMTLGTDGNFFIVTGTTTIKGIATADWQAGSMVTLMFTGATTLQHNGTPSVGFVGCKLHGATNLTTANGDIINLRYDGTVRRQTSPVSNTGA